MCQAVEKGEVYDVAGNKTYSKIPNPKCTLRNVVYALLCDRCKITVYVGETERSVKERVIPLFHTEPESHELTRIDKYLDSWLNRTQFVKVLTDSHSP